MVKKIELKEYKEKIIGIVEEYLNDLKYDFENDCDVYGSQLAKEIRDNKYTFAIEQIEEILDQIKRG